MCSFRLAMCGDNKTSYLESTKKIYRMHHVRQLEKNNKKEEGVNALYKNLIIFAANYPSTKTTKSWSEIDALFF
jgi:hypothetical protein